MLLLPLLACAGFIDERTKAFPRQVFAFSVDGIAIILGSLFGCAPLTVYIESASGIREGGRTGITAIVVAFGFFISLFFTPLIVSIPPYATGPALILVSGVAGSGNLVNACHSTTCWSVCVCESYIGKPIGTRAVPQFTTGVIVAIFTTTMM